MKLQEKICKQCTKTFLTHRKKSVNCSVECQRLSCTKKLKINCDFCGKEYLMHRYRLKEYKRHFCSYACKIRDKQSVDLFKIGTSFKKGYLPWNKGKSWSDEMKKKMSESHKGKQMGKYNPSWKGGQTPFINKLRRLKEYKDWQINVMKRDDYTCLKCLKRGVRLTPHHLKAFSYLIGQLSNKDIQTALNCNELWDVNNGVTLCHECHKFTPNYSTKAIRNPIDKNNYFLNINIGMNI